MNSSVMMDDNNPTQVSAEADRAGRAERCSGRVALLNSQMAKEVQLCSCSCALFEQLKVQR